LVQTAFLLGNFNYFLSISESHTATLQKQWNLIDTVGFSAGKHQFKFGADYRKFTPFAKGYPQSIVFYINESEVQNNEAFEASVQNNLPQNALLTNYSFFTDDSWKISARLNLSLGLRWEINHPPGVTRGPLPF